MDIYIWVTNNIQQYDGKWDNFGGIFWWGDFGGNDGNGNILVGMMIYHVI